MTRRATILLRTLGVIVVLVLGLSGLYAWSQYVGQRDYRIAKEFCGSVHAGASEAEILKIASLKSGKKLGTDSDGVLVVKFGTSRCFIRFESGVSTGNVVAVGLP